MRNDPGLIPSLFNDPADAPVLRYDRFNPDEVNRQIEDVGFAIVRGLVPEDRIERIRKFWIDTFSKDKPTGRVTWGPYFGQANHIGFSSDTFQHLYRACDFLWNEPFHAESRDVCTRLYALRNVLLNDPPFSGMRATDGRFGIFVTASYYPPGLGRMEQHSDGVPTGKRLVHSLVPITFKGTHYKEGGMHIVDRKGNAVDVDAQIRPGDVVYYDGSLQHGVKPIVAMEGSDLGRIQIFPIPTVFNNLENNIFAIARIPTSKFLRGKYFAFKNRVRILLGLSPAMR